MTTTEMEKPIPQAEHLTEQTLIILSGAVASMAQGKPFRKADAIPVLVKYGFPERVHGKPYAKKHVGKFLDRLSRMGFIEKAGSGKWKPCHN